MPGKLKIFFNGLSARRGGAEVFLQNLLNEFLENDQLNIILVCAKESGLYRRYSADSRILVMPFNSYSGFLRILAEHIIIPFMCLKRKIDCLFQPDDTLSPVAVLLRIKTVVLFHASIQFYSGRELGDSWLKIKYWRLLKQLALKYSSIAVTVSFCTKAELARGSKAMLDKVRVVYHGIDHKLFNTEPCCESKPFEFKYLLSVSNRNPHKNYPRLLQAFSLLIERQKTDVHLVLIGAAVIPSEENRIQKIIDDHKLYNLVHLVDPMPNSQLYDYYKNSTGYVYASVFDSFGLTPMEAMACGIPCAVSMYSALPETCGDAPVYFNPFQTESIYSALDMLVNDTKTRNNCIETGLRHVKRFNWHEASEKYLSFLCELTNGK